MKLKFNHNSDNVMESLGVSKERMDEIVGGAQNKLKAKYQSGTKVQLLDYLLRECETQNEMVATTIVWRTITDQMDKMKFLQEEDRKQKSKEFAEKLGVDPENKIKLFH